VSRLWTPEEDAFLRQHYPTSDPTWIAEQLDRSRKVIGPRANQLGVHRLRPWSEEEVLLLQERYADTSIRVAEMIPGRTAEQVRATARFRGLHRGSDHLKGPAPAPRKVGYKRIPRPCDECGADFLPTSSRAQRYCTPLCRGRARSKRTTARDRYSYVRLPSGRLRGRHRCVMEAAIGRELRPEETVHHKDGNRRHNELSNLELWSSRHPAGQRVEDLVEFALDILALYAPEQLSAPRPIPLP
jgi:hypothetical protein